MAPYVYLSSLIRLPPKFDCEYSLGPSNDRDESTLELLGACLQEDSWKCYHAECELYLRFAKPDDPKLRSNEYANR
jgi:hypothetical protein